MASPPPKMDLANILHKPKARRSRLDKLADVAAEAFRRNGLQSLGSHEDYKDALELRVREVTDFLCFFATNFLAVERAGSAAAAQLRPEHLPGLWQVCL